MYRNQITYSLILRRRRQEYKWAVPASIERFTLRVRVQWTLVSVNLAFECDVKISFDKFTIKELLSAGMGWIIKRYSELENVSDFSICMEIKHVLHHLCHLPWWLIFVLKITSSEIYVLFWMLDICNFFKSVVSMFGGKKFSIVWTATWMEVMSIELLIFFIVFASFIQYNIFLI